MSERVGIYKLLSFSPIYESFQRMMGGRRSGVFLSFVRMMNLEQGDRVLDVGCGPGRLLSYLPEVEYIGFEPNPRYVASARERYGSRANFNVGYFDASAAKQLRNIDVAIVSAVLHHMTDDEAVELFKLLRQVLSPNGRVVSLDCVFHTGQTPVSRTLARLDRGKHVRTPEAYSALAHTCFPQVDGQLLIKSFPPYSYWIMTAANFKVA